MIFLHFICKWLNSQLYDKMSANGKIYIWHNEPFRLDGHEITYWYSLNKKKDVIQVVLILTENYINIVILLISIKFQFCKPGTYVGIT